MGKTELLVVSKRQKPSLTDIRNFLKDGHQNRRNEKEVDPMESLKEVLEVSAIAIVLIAVWIWKSIHR